MSTERSPKKKSSSFTDGQLYNAVTALMKPSTREESLFFLHKQKEKFPDFAPVIWHSFGTVTILIQELLAIYPHLHGPQELPQIARNRCCQALAVFQAVAGDDRTKRDFMRAQIPLYIYPIIGCRNNVCKDFEGLRITGLGVMGSLLQVSF